MRERCSRASLRAGVGALAGIAAAMCCAFHGAWAEPIVLGPGPHLLLDDYLIEDSSLVVRRIMEPQREAANPLITGQQDGNFQPYVTVVRDPETKRFRVWYNIQLDGRRRSTLGYMESDDGVAWERPHRELDLPFEVTYGASILDRGPAYPDSGRRFKFGYYHDGGLRIAVSSDGLDWESLAPNALVPCGDITSIYWDPVRRRYGANLKQQTGPRDWLGNRLRKNAHSVSEDLPNWSEPRLSIYPDERDYGETQFYCMDGVLARGDLLIGLVRVLRDDLPAEPDGEIAGIGYTTLAWSRDGAHWERDREPFLPRSSEPGAWDRAMAWGSSQTPVGGELYIYYGGYQRGHKIERNTERRIGLARIPRDRYVAREAGAERGRLLTRPVTLDAKSMTLNANAADGEIRVRVLDLDGEPVPGFSFSECEPVTMDALDAQVTWSHPLSELAHAPVRLEIEMERAQLFAIGLHSGD